MQDTPPRRSRRPPPSDSGGSFPLIPIVLGMIVIGFIIGAGLSIAGKREPATVALATSAPTTRATLAPATFAPTEKPTREPTNEPATQPPATQDAASEAPQTNVPTTKAPATQTPATPSPGNDASVSASPVASALATRSSPAAVAAVTPTSVDDVDTDFGRLAASVVRGYLNAVAHGDSASAASSLASSSDTVTESSVVDATTRIKHVEARGVGDAATVNVDFETSTGAYFGQYTVRRTPNGAAVIVAHTIIKP